MKKILLLSILISVVFQTNAQEWDEWFSQKSTQRKYSIRQIAALRVYLDYLKKGYATVQKGLYTIENIKNGNFNLDRDFFNGLKNVNPAIAGTVKVADIIAFQYYITRDMSKVYAFCSSNREFTAEEIRYIARVHTNLLTLTDANMSELWMILGSGGAEMSDDERIERIDKIHSDLRDKSAFVKAFNDDTRLISLSRAKDRHEIGRIKNSIDIP